MADIDFSFDGSTVDQGVAKNLRSLDALIAKLSQLERKTATYKNDTTLVLQDALAKAEQTNRSMLNVLNEVRKNALSSLQAGTQEYTKLVAEQNKAINALYNQRLSEQGKLSVDEIRIWKDLGVSIGILQNKQLKDSNAARKTEAAQVAAHQKQLRNLTAAALADQKKFATDAQALYQKLSASGAGSMTYAYKKDTATALEALRNFYRIEEQIRGNAGKQSAINGPLSSIRQNVELDSKAILASLSHFYTVMSTAAQTKQMSGPLASIRVKTPQDSADILEQMRKFYTVAAQISNNFGKQSSVNGPLSSIRQNIELDSKLILADMQRFYTVMASSANVQQMTGPLSSIRVRTEADSGVILGVMKQFYSIAEQINKNFGIQAALVGSPLSSILKKTEIDSAAILAAMRKHYADIERVQRNAAYTKAGGSANMGVGRRTPGIDDTAAASAAALAQTRAMYLEAGATSNYDNTSAEAAKLTALGKAAATAGPNLRKLGGDMNYAHSMARGLASGFGLLWLTWGSLAPLFIGAALSNGLVQTAKAGMEVAHTFATIEHLGGNTRAEMESLHGVMLDLARTGPFAPREIADAMKVLSLAGLKANEILAVTKDVLNFSVAGTTDLKTAAETLMTISTAFGMGAEGFGRVADVVSKAAAVSLSSVESIANAMKTASVINAQYGVSLEDTGTAIAAMSKLGIQGTAAGTALRNMYADLSGRSVQVAKVLKAQGIEMRDSTGAMRPMIEVVADLNAKLGDLDGIGQKNLLQAILSERGAKGMIELLRLIRTEAKGAGEGLANELERMRSEIAESAGFAAITAAKMAQTTKSQFEAVKATFGAAMEEAYQQMAPSMALIFNSLKQTFASPEFVSGLTWMVTTLSRFVLVIAENAKALAVLATGYAILKTAQFAAGVASTLVATATERATAASVARAGALAVETAAERANSAGKIAGVVGLARFIPGLNLALAALTVGWIGVQYWLSKSSDTAQTASEFYNSSVIKDLKDQNDKLERLNALRRTGLSLQEAELRLQGQVDSARISGDLKAAKDRVVDAEVRYAGTEGMSDRSRDFERNRLQNERIQLAHARKRALDAEMDMESERQRTVKLSKDRDAITDAEVARRRAEAEKFGPNTFVLGTDASSGAAAATNQYTAAVNNNSAALEKQKDAEISAATTRSNSTLGILEAMHSAKLINDGAYERAVIESTTQFEEEKFRVISRSNGELRNEAVRVNAELQAEAALDVASSKLKANELAKFKEQRKKKLDEDLASLAEKTKAMIDGNNSEIEKIERESLDRRLKAQIAYEGRVKALRKEAADYLKKMAEDSAAADAQEAFSKQWGSIGSNSPAEMQANKAAAEAALQATQRHRAEVVRLEQVLKDAKEAYAGMQGTEESTDATVKARAISYKAAMEAAEVDLEAFRIASGEDVAKESARAYRTAIEKENDRIKNGVADTIMTALVDGGEAGKKKLRDLLVEELKRPIRMYIDAFLNNITGGAGGNWIGMAKAAYDKYTGSGGNGGAGVAGAAPAAAAVAVAPTSTAAATGSTVAAQGTITNGMTQAQMIAAQNAGIEAGAASGAAAGSSAWATYAGYFAWVAAAIMVAEKFYSSGHNRTALGEKSDKAGANDNMGQYRYGVKGGNTTTGQNGGRSWMSNGILNLGASNLRRLMDAVGMNEKWADIFSGTTLMATLIGRRLKGYGFEAKISGSEVDVGTYERYKGGLFRSNKTIRGEAAAEDIKYMQTAIEGVRESAKATAKVMGLGTEAIDAYNGTVRVNYKGAKTGAEVAQRYQEAMDGLHLAMLNSIDGFKMSKEEFTKFREEALSFAQASGYSMDTMSATIRDGMLGRLDQSQVGEALSEQLLGSVYNALAGGFANSITEMITSQIITPLMMAVLTGGNISAVVNTASIGAVMASAQQAINAFQLILNDPAIQGMLGQLAGMSSQLAGMVTAPAKSIRYKTPSMRSSGASAGQSAAEKAAQERYSLETELYTLLGKTALLRERELAALSAGNRALQIQIWNLEDAKTAVEKALEAVGRAVEAEQKTVETQLETAREAEALLNDIFTTLKDNIKELRNEVDDVVKMQAFEAKAVLQGMLGGTMPAKAETVTEAVDALRLNLEQSNFASKVDKDRAALDLANFLSSVQDVVQPKLSEAEQMITNGEAQLETLEAQLKTAQEQVDILFGIDRSVTTVAASLAGLTQVMAAYSSLVASQGTTTANFSAESYFAKYSDLRNHWAAYSGTLSADPRYNQDTSKTALQEWLQWHYTNAGIKEGRTFASGGYYPGGMALVGEEGPELINFRNPGQVYTADQSRELFSARSDEGSGSANEQRLLQALEEANALNYSIARSNGKMLGILKRVTRKGTSIEVSTETPIQVSVV